MNGLFAENLRKLREERGLSQKQLGIQMFVNHSTIVRWENETRLPDAAMILRVFGAILIYVVVNTLLKLPFDKQFLAGTSLAAFLVRTARYAVIMFLIMGVYPMMFPRFEEIGKTKGSTNS